MPSFYLAAQANGNAPLIPPIEKRVDGVIQIERITEQNGLKKIFEHAPL
jgi:hypothetical protein